MLDHVADRLLRGREEIGPVRRRREVRTAIGAQADRAAGAKARLGDAAALRESEAQCHPRAHLHGGDADLAIALRAMRIADAEERAVDEHRQVERRARVELLDVHVAAAAPGRHRAVPAGLVERDTHHAGERRERHHDRTVRHARGFLVRQIPDAEVRLREIFLGQEAASRAHLRPSEIEGRHDFDDLDEQRVADVRAFHLHGPGEGMALEHALEHVFLRRALRIRAERRIREAATRLAERARERRRPEQQ